MYLLKGTLNTAAKFQGENKGQCGASGKNSLITTPNINVRVIGTHVSEARKEEQKPMRETRWVEIVEVL